MPGDAQHTAPPSPPAVICSGAIRQRDPPQFSGADDQDVEDWLSSFERVSAYNRWDEVTKLSNAGFSLRGVAEQWFLNHPADRSTWTAFTTNITRVFGRPAVRKLLAEQRLRERAQQAGETFTCYIEDVVDLCRRANPSMPEQDTVKHILKGIDEDAFQMLLAKNPQNVSEVVSLCQSYEELRRQRTLTRRRLSQRDDPLCALEVDGNPSLLRRIKELIREEVARQISLLPCLPQQSSPTQDPAQSSPLHQIIREQVADAISAAPEPLPVAPSLCYAEVAARTPAHAYVPRRRPQPPPHLTQVRPSPLHTNPWRTPDNRPICFSCRIPGHVARYCRRGIPPPGDAYWRPAYADNAYVPYRPYNDAHAEPPYSPPSRDELSSGARRSVSPRRRSISPMRRRPTAPEEN
ncbi:uncharacterized protein LOC144159808 [Haemaphysalis longicornis]